MDRELCREFVPVNTEQCDTRLLMRHEAATEIPELNPNPKPGGKACLCLSDPQVNVNCISQTLKRSGFDIANEKNSLFNIHWGLPLSDSSFAKLAKNAKANHFPGSSVLGRKDCLWANLSSQMRIFGEVARHLAPVSCWV